MRNYFRYLLPPSTVHLDQMLYQGKETEPDFLKAWHLQAPRRQAGRAIHRSYDDGQLLLYQDACAIGSQLQRVVD